MLQRLKLKRSIIRPELGAFRCLVVVGDFLVTVHAAGVLICYSVHRLLAEEPVEACEIRRIELALPAGIEATVVVHPDTYVNKLLVACSDGRFLIVNTDARQVLYRSKPLGASAADRADAADLVVGSSIVCAVQSPALDTIGFGLSNGMVVVHNVRKDKSVVVFRHEAGSAGAGGKKGTREAAGVGGGIEAVTALSFCNDKLREPCLLSGTSHGSVALWHLPERRLLWNRSAVHEGAVSAALFLPGESCYITCGARDNAMRQWLLDRLDSAPRMLRSREGAAAPATLARYVRTPTSVATVVDGADASVCEVVASGGSDRSMRYFHTALERQNREVSQGRLIKKAREMRLSSLVPLRLPRVTSISTCDRKTGWEGWHDIVTTHEGRREARLWAWDRKALGKVQLMLPGPEAEVATACIMAPSGDYAVVAGSLGTVCLYNAQTGAPRGCYPPSSKRHRGFARKGKKASKPGNLRDIPAGPKDSGRGFRDPATAHLGAHKASVSKSLSALLGAGYQGLDQKLAGQGSAEEIFRREVLEEAGVDAEEAASLAAQASLSAADQRAGAGAGPSVAAGGAGSSGQGTGPM